MSRPGRRTLKFLGISVGLAAVGGGVGYGLYRQRLKDNRSVTPAEFHTAQGEHFKTLMACDERQLRDRAARGLQLFRFQTCPFCGTVSALLDYCSLPYRVVEVDPMLKTPLRIHGYGRVPQLKFPDGTLLVDSEEITAILGAKLGLKYTPEVDKWRLWARQQLARYLVVVLNRTLRESVRAYDYIDPVTDVPWWSKALLKGVGGPVMYLVAKYQTRPKLQREFGLTDPDTHRALMGQLALWVESHQGQGYHGGKAPDAADLDVYGILTSARHHPLWTEMQEGSPAKAWMDRMEATLASRRRLLT
jgi:microsomal prostaglandin-E synthase 2